MSSNLIFRDDILVLADDRMGSDAKVIRMAKASVKRTGGDMTEAARYGFIEFLMRERHGVPFEHCAITFYWEVPIFVMRHLAKHRISSISEQSGRYVTLPSQFYLASPQRHLVQIGRPGAYRFEPGTPEQYTSYASHTVSAAEFAWQRYQSMLDEGIAREVARSVLPVSVYTSGYITLNLRSLMNLLSLRTSHEDALIKGHPQYETELLAECMEAFFRQFFPLTWAAFNAHGRVAP